MPEAELQQLAWLVLQLYKSLGNSVSPKACCVIVWLKHFQAYSHSEAETEPGFHCPPWPWTGVHLLGTESFPIIELFLVIGLKKDAPNLGFVSIKDFQDSSETNKMIEGQE